MPGQIYLSAGGEVARHPHDHLVLSETVNQVRAYETGPAGDQGGFTTKFFRQ